MVDGVGALLFFLETYHAVTHFLVLFRLRLLPAKDLSRVGYYFLIDTTTVFASSFLYTGELRWLAAVQIMQHMFFFLTWNKHPYTIKVMQWSSLDWVLSSNNAHWCWDIVLGTLFDLLVHIVFMSRILAYLSTLEASLGFLAAVSLTGALLYNRKYAWSSPGNEPDWVKRRITSNLPFYGQHQG